MVLGEKEQVIYGKGFIIDTLCGLTFKISPKSFYQVNPVQTETLFKKAIEYAGLTGKERVIDAYSGIGTILVISGCFSHRAFTKFFFEGRTGEPSTKTTRTSLLFFPTRTNT